MYQWKCEKCGKEYEKETKSKLQGAINLHTKIHCKGKTSEAAATPKEENSCLHSWIGLDPNYSQQAIAIQRGYKEVCKKCLEVR